MWSNDCKKVAVTTYEKAIKVFNQYHGSGIGGHFGSWKTTTTISRDFKRKNMTNHISQWVRVFAESQNNISDF